MTERVTEIDLHAYVDDQLDIARRVEVEAYLQDHPDTAAMVMRDLKLRDEIRLFLAAEEVPGPAAKTIALSRELGRRLKRRSWGFRIRRSEERRVGKECRSRW